MPTPERAIFLFDGPNFYKNLKHCGLEKGHLSLYKLAQNLAGPRSIVEVIYFTSPTDSETDSENYVAQQRFFAALQSSGVTLKLGKLVKRSTICPECRHRHFFKTEKSVDVQIAMSLVLGCTENLWDVVYLATCDSGLIPPIEYARAKGKKVFLIMPDGAHCYSVGNACTTTIPVRQSHIDSAQAFSSE